MASRNKKGKIHGIFKNEFHISFFHKPSMEETDCYYYMILDDVIFIKMRLLADIFLIIEDLYPLTSSYISQEYEKLFNLLKTQSVVTVLVSLIGNTSAFRQTCLGHDAPVIDDERFVDYPQTFYNKYKNYCGNNSSMYGFFLIALKDESFEMLDKSLSKKEPIIEELDDIEEERIPEEDIIIEEVPKDNILEYKLSKLKDFLFGQYPDISITPGEDRNMTYIKVSKDTTLHCYDEKDDSIYIVKIENAWGSSYLALLDLLNMLQSFSSSTGITVYILNVSNDTREYDFLESEWIRVINGISVNKLPMWDYRLASFRSE